MTFLEALKAEFGDRPFLASEVADSEIPTSSLPPTVLAGIRDGRDPTQAIAHHLPYAEGVVSLGRRREGKLWTVES